MAFRLLLLARSIGWLQSVATLVLGSGLTVLITTLTAKEAVHQQYAKEANLRRKTEIYGPLHAELKKLRECLNNARMGVNPYPQWIAAAGADPPLDRPQPGYDVPTLNKWSEFRSDYRRDDFKEPTQRQLDEVERLAMASNTAVDGVRSATREILVDHIAGAIADAKKSGNLAWLEAYEAMAPTGQSLAEVWSTAWVEIMVTLQPPTLGWLLARQPDKAADWVHATWRRIANPPPPERTFLQKIFNGTWQEIDERQIYCVVWDLQEKLLEGLSDAEKNLADGLRDIQNRYEGGAPPV